MILGAGGKTAQILVCVFTLADYRRRHPNTHTQRCHGVHRQAQSNLNLRSRRAKQAAASRRGAKERFCLQTQELGTFSRLAQYSYF